MLKHYNFIFGGRIIEVEAASSVEARAKAFEICKDLRNEDNETNEPVILIKFKFSLAFLFFFAHFNLFLATRMKLATVFQIHSLPGNYNQKIMKHGVSAMYLFGGGK